MGRCSINESLLAGENLDKEKSDNQNKIDPNIMKRQEKNSLAKSTSSNYSSLVVLRTPNQNNDFYC